MKRLRKTPCLLALLVLALPLMPVAVGDETPVEEIAVLRDLETKTGVTLWLKMNEDKSRATSLAVKPNRADVSIHCPIPEDEKQLERFRIGLIPEFDDESNLQSMKVVTWRKPGVGDAPPAFIVRADSGATAESIRTSHHMECKPVWTVVHGKRRLHGFELSVLAAREKAPAERGKIERTGKSEKPADTDADKEAGNKPAKQPIEREKLVIKLPEKPVPGQAYGLIISPIWKKRGVTLAGYEAVLAVKVKPGADAEESGRDTKTDDQDGS